MTRPAGLRTAVALRPATAEDTQRLFSWRNDPDTRRGSFDEREIPWDEHRSWFESSLARGDRRIYIASVDGTPVGVLRVDLAGDEGTVSITIASEWRGQSIGVTALGMLARRVGLECGVARLIAHVRPENTPSIRAFEAAGYRVTAWRPDRLTFALEVALDEARRLEALWRGEFGRAYTERNAGKGERRARFWSRLLSRLDVGSVLEVGSNIGLNLRFIAARIQPGPVVGIDVNEYPLPRLLATVPTVRAVAATARALPFRNGAFDLVFTMGVLIHQAPDILPAAMREIVRCSRRWVLCGEYFAETLTEVAYRGQRGALFKLDFGRRYLELAPHLRLVEQGRLAEDDGWDDITFWLFERGTGAA